MGSRTADTGLNRTFVELKLKMGANTKYSATVLIEPLWN